jgi:membrane-bound lytic murein transglycosylase D
MWYLQNQISRQAEYESFNDLEDIGDFNSDSVRFTTNVPDSVLVERLKRMNSFITLPFNPIVKNYMILYSEKNVAKMKRILSLSDYYFPIFEDILSKYDMPLELKYMAVIESALNPVARSRAGARGIWQFMYRTGRQYGLRINSFVDERLDVVKAADAAARYMSDAYSIFGDWALAISSYNCGPGNVNKAIRRAGGRRDFWSIYPYLPRETRGYVPAFVGAMYAMTYYREYGIEPNPSPMPAHTDTFVINRNLHFGQISDLIGVPIDDLRELNSQYIHDIVPGNESPYVLKLPYQYTASFLDCQDTVYTHLADSLLSPQILKSVETGTVADRGTGGGNVIRYRVRSGDYLGRIASRYHVSVRQIMNWNHLRSNNIRVGQVLTIYQGGAAPAASSNTSTSGSSKAASGEYTVYTVRSGDSLFKISQRYGVTVKAIMDLNHCSSNIKAGQKLKIPKK